MIIKLHIGMNEHRDFLGALSLRRRAFFSLSNRRLVKDSSENKGKRVDYRGAFYS